MGRQDDNWLTWAERPARFDFGAVLADPAAWLDVCAWPRDGRLSRGWQLGSPREPGRVWAGMIARYPHDCRSGALGSDSPVLLVLPRLFSGLCSQEGLRPRAVCLPLAAAGLLVPTSRLVLQLPVGVPREGIRAFYVLRAELGLVPAADLAAAPAVVRCLAAVARVRFAAYFAQTSPIALVHRPDIWEPVTNWPQSKARNKARLAHARRRARAAAAPAAPAAPAAAGNVESPQLALW